MTFTSPANLEVGVGTNEKIAATFSTGMDVASLTATFTLEGVDTIHMPGIIAYDAATNIATFSPSGDLEFNATYTAIITTDAQNTAGVGLANDFTWTFTTGAAPTPPSPSVTNTNPKDGEAGVALDIQLTATFSVAMDPSTINETQFTLTGPGDASVAGVVTYDSDANTAAFTPATDLAIDTQYTATISSAVQDSEGMALRNDHTWVFSTGETVDRSDPRVTRTNPANGAVAVAINQQVVATFDEPLNPSTIGAAQFTLTDANATAVTGVVTYSDSGNTAIFTPATDLAVNTEFTATIASTVQDRAGNDMKNDYTWRFTTGTAADSTAPAVILTSPADTDTDVAINRQVTAEFSEQMDSSTIGATQFTLFSTLSGFVTGVVTYDAGRDTATFTPDSVLAANTTYTATISPAAQDLAGNGLAGNVTWSFTTAP